MPKPSDLPNWATDANYAAGAEPEQGTPTKVEPISSKQASGWRPEEKPKAQSLNWWQNLVYQWVLYVDSNSIDGDLTVSGDLHVDGIISPSGTLQLDGAVESQGPITATGSDITAGGNLIAADGAVYFTTPIRTPVALALAKDSGAHTLAYNQLIFSASAQVVRIPIIGIPAGAHLDTLHLRVFKGDNDGLSIRVSKSTDAGADNDFAEAFLADAPGSNYTYDLDMIDLGADETIDGLSVYSIKIVPSGGITPAQDRVYKIELGWHYPAP